MKRLIAGVLLALALAAIAPAGALGAEPRATVELTDFPVSVAPTDNLRITLDVTNDGNEPIRDLRVGIAIHEGIETRSHLARTVGGNLGSILGSDTVAIEGEIETGESRSLTVEKAISDLAFFRSRAEDRAYPVVVTLRSARTEIKRIVTFMIFFASTPQVRLNMALVIPVHLPVVYTDGDRPSLITSGSVERQLSNGRLASLVSGLNSVGDLPITIAPTGLMLDTLQDMADGYSRLQSGKAVAVPATDPRAKRAASFIEQLKQIANRGQVRVITTPYSAAFLPGLVRADLSERAQAQVVQGNIRVDRALNTKAIDGWLLPTRGGLDERTFSDLRNLGITKMVVEPSTVTDQSVLTRAQAVELQTRGGAPIYTLVSDKGLNKTLEETQGLSPILARQRFLAETATIFLERPATPRVVAAMTPLEWSASPQAVAAISAAVASATWIHPVTPDIAHDSFKPVQLSPTSRTRRQSQDQIQLASIDSVLRSGPPSPDSEYFGAIRQAIRAIDRYADLTPPADRLARFEQRLLLAESADWWDSRGEIERGTEFARAVPAAIDKEFDKIRAPASQTITLTSLSGVIPISIASELEYPVDVVIRLDSDKLKFPKGNRIRRRLQGPNQTIEVQTIAQATGTFPLRVVVETPSSGATISSSSMVVRSTAYNVVAVAITSGAAIFLLVSWTIGTIRRRALAT